MSKRVLITGAAGGIGAATALELERRGAHVAGLDVSAVGGVIACDVRDQASVDRAVAKAVQTLGGLDVLINCAGIGDPQSASAPPGDDALRVLDVNLLGPWRVTGAAMPALRESRGRVVNVASGLSHLAVPLAPAYCMSKRGLVAYSDSLRLEMAGEVEVTTVYPGYIRTPIHDAATEKGIGLEGLVPAEPLEAAVGALVRATLGQAQRDIATSRKGAVGYALLRVVPRRLMDRLTRARMRRAVARGAFGGEGLASELRGRLSSGA